MKDYIKDEIKYRIEAGENKIDIAKDLHNKNLITDEEFVELGGIMDDYHFNNGKTSVQDLIQNFGEKDVRELLKIFDDLINDYYNYDHNDNYRIKKVGDLKYEDLYKKAEQNGCCGSFDEIYNVNGTDYSLGFNYGH
jgi:hypothetical protein